MSTIKKGIIVPPTEWAKHLRPFGKRQQAKRERRAAKTFTKLQIGGNGCGINLSTVHNLEP